ncbi:MAG: hypothetical protein LQ347_004088 [Umbilicaria vellea]|nr:MAG: hypothetical protein LQ347_004088 [Umbilicaria vellea]
MAEKTPSPKQVIVIVDEDRPKKVGRPETQHGKVNRSSAAHMMQNATVPDRTSRPYSLTGRRTPSSHPTAPPMKPLPRFRFDPDITIVRAKSFSGSDSHERQTKRPKLVPSGTEVVDSDPIRRRMGVIDLENMSMSKDQTAETSKLNMGHYKKLQYATAVQMPSRLDPGSNLPGGFLAGDYMTEEQLNTWLQQTQGKNASASPMRSPHLPPVSRPKSAKPSQRNGPVLPPLVLLKSYNHNGSNLRPYVNVELQNGDFMRIIHVIQDTYTSAVSLRGHMFQRTREMNGVLKKALNEVCWVLHVDEDDEREPSIQAMGDVLVSHVVKRRAIKMTNQPFPALSFRMDPLMDEAEEAVSRNRVLVCRWKYLCYYRNAEARDRNAYSQRVLQRIQMVESDTNSAVEDEQLRYNWRGDTIKGGAALEGTVSGHLVSAELGSSIASPFALDPRAVIDLEPSTTRTNMQNYHSRRDSRDRSGSDRYSKTTIIASAGLRKSLNLRPQTQFPCDSFNSIISVEDNPDPDFGTKQRTANVSYNKKAQVQHQSPEVVEVEGYVKKTSKKGVLEQAYRGLNVKWGFDYNDLACKSYLLNFHSPSTSVYCLSADQFSSLQGEDHKVDVLHLSPPCQTFSPAHTIDGKDDDQNSASLFAVSELLKKARPRVVTLEQTAGLKTLYPQYLNALVQMFTEHGFNIRYKICHLQEYGLPQTRSRLIIIASCPGEVLPEYPKSTHSSNPQQTGLRPLSTINKAIRNIPPDTADHDLTKARNTSAGPAYNGDRQTNCITTSGGGVYHPSGRKFTHREIACLNGFPLEHLFCGKGTKKQIGNAVPPMVGKIFLAAVRKALEKADGL